MKILIEVNRRADVIRIIEDEGKYWATKTQKQGDSQKRRISRYEALKVVRLIRRGPISGRVEN